MHNMITVKDVKDFLDGYKDFANWGGRLDIEKPHLTGIALIHARCNLEQYRNYNVLTNERLNQSIEKGELLPLLFPGFTLEVGISEFNFFSTIQTYAGGSVTTNFFSSEDWQNFLLKRHPEYSEMLKKHLTTERNKVSKSAAREIEMLKRHYDDKINYFNKRIQEVEKYVSLNENDGRQEL